MQLERDRRKQARRVHTQAPDVGPSSIQFTDLRRHQSRLPGVVHAKGEFDAVMGYLLQCQWGPVAGMGVSWAELCADFLLSSNGGQVLSQRAGGSMVMPRFSELLRRFQKIALSVVQANVAGPEAV
eukprot:6605349-Alexandrium_andersonii.AAC.1